MTENTGAIVSSRRISPASVPPLAETVELILVNKIDFLASCHPGDKVPAPIRLHLGAEALLRGSCWAVGQRRGSCASCHPGGKAVFGAGLLPIL